MPAEDRIGLGMVGPSSKALHVPSSKGLVAPSWKVLGAWRQVFAATAAPSLQVASTGVASRAIETAVLLLWGCKLCVLQPNHHRNIDSV